MEQNVQKEERRLNTNVQHIYSALRSALVDRDRDTDEEYDNHIIVQIDDVQFALKKEVPSGALLISYMMLYYPGLLERCHTDEKIMFIGRAWVGGEANTKMPIFVSDMLFGIALAIGTYAGFIQTIRHPQLGEIMLRPNMMTPMVSRSRELIRENDLTILDARDVFIELMQDEEFRVSIPVADDYIANTSWIIESGVQMTDDGVDRIEVAAPKEG